MRKSPVSKVDVGSQSTEERGIVTGTHRLRFSLLGDHNLSRQRNLVWLSCSHRLLAGQINTRFFPWVSKEPQTDWSMPCPGSRDIPPPAALPWTRVPARLRDPFPPSTAHSVSGFRALWPHCPVGPYVRCDIWTVSMDQAQGYLKTLLPQQTPCLLKTRYPLGLFDPGDPLTKPPSFLDLPRQL